MTLALGLAALLHARSPARPAAARRGRRRSDRRRPRRRASPACSASTSPSARSSRSRRCAAPHGTRRSRSRCAVTAAITVGVLSLRSGDLGAFLRSVGIGGRQDDAVRQRGELERAPDRRLHRRPRSSSTIRSLGTGWHGELPPEEYVRFLDDARARFPDQPPTYFPSADERFIPQQTYDQVLYELGIVGALLFLVLALVTVRTAVPRRAGVAARRSRRARGVPARGLGRRARRRARAGPRCSAASRSRPSSGSRSASPQLAPSLAPPPRVRVARGRRELLDRARDRAAERRRRRAARAPARARAGAARPRRRRRRGHARRRRGVDGVRRRRARRSRCSGCRCCSGSSRRGPTRARSSRCADLIRSRRPDVLHTHTAKAGATGRLAALAAGRARPRAVVHTYHGHVLSGYFSRRWERVFR